MKNLKSRTRPSPEEALSIATLTAPSLPPTQLAANDRATTLNLRVRVSTVEAIMASARERRMTMKQVVCEALSEAGVAVAASDLEERTPRRKGVRM